MRFSRPVDVKGVQRLIGLVNYLARFLDGLADVCEPIRQLTRKGRDWQWNEEQERAFVKIKELIASAAVLRYFDPELETTLQCDASDIGIGASLMQNGQPVAYASRSLTSAERNYAQIKKEFLAIVFGVERFTQYTYGRKVRVESDHRPLETIYKKPLVIAHIDGSNLEVGAVKKEIEAVRMADFVPIPQRSLEEIKEESQKDSTIRTLEKLIHEGWPEDKKNLPKDVIPYFQFRDQLSVEDGIVYYGNRCLVPMALRASILSKIHRSHVGMEGCLRRARESIYWPGMNAEVREMVSKCEVCRACEVAQSKEKLYPHEIPSRLWYKVAVDLFEFEQKQYLVTVDYYSNFWEVDQLETNATSKSVIGKLRQQFARDSERLNIGQWSTVCVQRV